MSCILGACPQDVRHPRTHSGGNKLDSISVNKFRDNIRTFVEEVVSGHHPLKVTRRSGEAFVVIGAEDWEREQETLFVLQNNSLMQQISASLATHVNRNGYTPTAGEIDEIIRI